MLELPDLIEEAYKEIIYLRQFRMGLIQVILALFSVELLGQEILNRK